MQEDWIKKIEEQIEIEKTKIHKRDVKFYQTDQLIRIAKRLNDNEDTCNECKSLKTNIEDIADNLSSYINSIPKGRRKLEKEHNLIAKHLKKEHQIYPLFYFVSFYSFLGMSAGVFVGLVVSLFFPEIKLLYILFITWFIGLSIGYLIGNKKDWAVRREKRFL